MKDEGPGTRDEGLTPALPYTERICRAADRGYVELFREGQKLERELMEVRKDLEMAKGSIRILRAETATICVGRKIIGILAREGCWKSESGTALIAADDLFRRDPCEELAWVCNLLGRANQYLQAQGSSEALQFKKEIEEELAKRRAVHGLGGNPPPGNTAGQEEGA